VSEWIMDRGWLVLILSLEGLLVALLIVLCISLGEKRL